MAHIRDIFNQFKLTILLTAVLCVDTCVLEVKSSERKVWLLEQTSFHVACGIRLCPNSKGSLQFTWHVVKKCTCEQLGTSSGTEKYTISEAGALSLHSLQVNDSGVYHCGVALDDQGKRKQIIGHGTTLTVTVLGHQIQQAVLWFLFGTLALYSVVVLILLIMRMTGHDIPILRGRCGRDSNSKINSTRRMHFRAVLQELYSRRNLVSSAKMGERGAPANSQFENPHSPTQDEDIYQNM